LQLVLPDLSAAQWAFDGPDQEVSPPIRLAPLSVNVAEALAEAIREGMGIGPLPLSLALQGFRDCKLVPVFPGRKLRANNIYALYASRHYLDAKIKTFLDFIKRSVPLRLTQQELDLARFWAER
jgi:DNA-binding transcriptional LysR family regulator